MKKTIFFTNLIVVSTLFGMQSDSFKESSLKTSIETKSCVQNLIYATEHSDCETMQAILDCNEIDINAQDDDGNMALTVAVGLWNKEKITLLLKYGADIELIKQKIDKKTFSKLRKLYHQVQDTNATIQNSNNKHQDINTKLQKKIKNSKKKNRDANKEFKKAIMDGNEKKVRDLLKNSTVDVNARIRYTNREDHAEYIALIWAAEQGYKTIVELLLQQPNIDINIKDSQGFTALMCAAEQGRMDVVELLLQQPNIKVNIQNNKGSTALIFAVKENHIEIVNQLLSRPDIDVNVQTNQGGTALICAVTENRIKVVKQLLHHPDININLQTNNGVTALKCAYDWGREEIAYILKNYKRPHFGVNEPKYKVNEDLAKKKSLHNENKTLNKASWQILDANKDLSKAIMEGSINKIRFILANKPVDINFGFPLLGDTVLMHAAMLGRTKAVKLLLQQPNVDVNVRDKNGITSLICSSAMGHEEIVKMLLDHGNVNVNDGAKNGITSLMAASTLGHKEIVKMLLDHGADVNISNNIGKTSLMLAVLSESEEIVRILLEHGASSDNKQAALMTAVALGYEKIVETLLEDRSVDVNIKDKFGDTPLTCAIRNGYAEIVDQLLKHGADINERDLYGISPLEYAIEERDVRIIQLLLNHKQRIHFDSSNDRKALVDKAKETDRKKIVELIQSEITLEESSKEKIELEPVESFPETIDLKPTKSINERFWEAVSQGDGNTIDSLLKEKNFININEKNTDGDTPLIVALRKGYINVVRSLLEGNADIFIRDSKGDTALLIAADKGNLEAMNLLISYKADISDKDVHGNNAFIRAAQNGHLGVINELMLRRLNFINSTGEYKRTALMGAAENGHVRIVRFLINKGAKTKVKDGYDKTALDIVNDKIEKLSKIQKEKVLNKNDYESIRDLLQNTEEQTVDSFKHLSIINPWTVDTNNRYEKELKNWAKDAPDTYKTIKMLINEIKVNPFKGRGRPESLKGTLKGLYSRKINEKDRLIYEVDGEKVILRSCKGHYEKENR